MAIEQPGFKVGFMKAAADYSDGAKQFRFMKSSGNDAEFVVCSVSGEPAIGVLQDKPKSGKPGEIMVTGVSKVIVGAADLAAGAYVQSDANGAAIAYAANKAVAGVVLIGAAAGKLATILIGHATGATKA
jgi:hypothetical protein